MEAGRQLVVRTALPLQHFLENLHDPEQIHGLTSLDSSDCALTREIGPLKVLISLNAHTLGHLSLANTHICAAQPEEMLQLMAPIAAIRSLRSLDVSACDLLGPRGMKYTVLNELGSALAKWRTVQSLRLSRNRLHAEAAGILSQWLLELPQLRSLDISE